MVNKKNMVKEKASTHGKPVAKKNHAPAKPASGAPPKKHAKPAVEKAVPAKAVPANTAPEAVAVAIAPQLGKLDLTEKVKELVRLAQEQGYLTYNDINDALGDSIVSPDELDDL